MPFENLHALPPSVEAELTPAGNQHELLDLDLEIVSAGKDGKGGGGGGGGGGDPVLRGFARLSAFQDFQARSFRNSGVRVGSAREGRYIP